MWISTILDTRCHVRKEAHIFTFPIEVTLHPTNHDIRYRVGARLRNNRNSRCFSNQNIIPNAAFRGMLSSTISSESQFWSNFFPTMQGAGENRNPKPTGWEIQFWLYCRDRVPTPLNGHLRSPCANCRFEVWTIWHGPISQLHTWDGQVATLSLPFLNTWWWDWTLTGWHVLNCCIFSFCIFCSPWFSTFDVLEKTWGWLLAAKLCLNDASMSSGLAEICRQCRSARVDVAMCAWRSQQQVMATESCGARLGNTFNTWLDLSWMLDSFRFSKPPVVPAYPDFLFSIRFVLIGVVKHRFWVAFITAATSKALQSFHSVFSMLAAAPLVWDA